ncbi:MAG: Hsp20/alpha crystallin family protein [Gammaproteobacteria bacterium]|nr:MAG: Hsp20/alpha crystallin family protein [Gammaproteobacteria bacterium]
MWLEALALLERAERLQRHFFQPRPGRARAAWEPPVDVVETEEDLWVLVALPGVDPAHLEVAVADGTLVVAGERRLPASLRRGYFHRLEIPHGRFERRIELPPGAYELQVREFLHGCLVLGLRKRW